MVANTSSQKRRGHSIEVVDAKVAVDLATASTYSENVFLFVPNLIVDIAMQRTLFFVCAGNELFYVSLYLMKWTSTPIGLPSPLGELTYAQTLALLSLPICVLKNVINLVQLWKASKILVGVDLAERASARKAQEERGRPKILLFAPRPFSALPSSPSPRRPVSRSPRKRLYTFSNPSDPPPDKPSTPDPPPAAEEKVTIRRVRLTPPTEPVPSIELPDDLDILWTPGQELSSFHTSALPPSENFDDALNKLLITLHPQTQHRATYPSPLGAPTEPTLALYSPIEGGDYIIDATVAELARRTNAEVLVLDAVQLAAGEWSQFGPAANSLSLPRNPLHFPSLNTSKSSPSSIESDEVDNLDNVIIPPKISLALMTPSISNGSTRQVVTSTTRRTSPPSKVKVFFDALVNTPSKAEKSPPKSRPRLVYIRDFPTLAATASSWYPPLLSAVRERRKGPISRPSSPVTNPMTIIFGMTPPLTPSSSQDSPGNGLLSMLISRSPSAPQLSPTSKSIKSDWGEDDASERARERRLRERLRKWESGDAILAEEFPKLSHTEEGEPSGDRPDVLVIGSLALPGLSGSSSSSPNDAQPKSSFFRTSILIPKVRSLTEERAARMSRRREINELTMRMGIGAAGGILDQERAAPSLDAKTTKVDHEATSSVEPHPDSPAQESEAPFHHESLPTSADVDPEVTHVTEPRWKTPAQTQMWEDWGHKIEAWSDVRRIADRALGDTLASAISDSSPPASLQSTTVPWSAVHAAWAAHCNAKDLRSSWLKTAFSAHKVAWEAKTEENEPKQMEKPVDEVVESIRNDADLDRHEERLLGCIVDAASMPTSFDQVHLPAHTIDSVRTIVSLPLLHPQAFQQGILKQHGMTGCLLFGPPGTGKTLVVRALAKEAGCRMLMVSPSDVMDMVSLNVICIRLLPKLKRNKQYVGEGEKLVKALFNLARRLSPCVVFLDEIDALFGARMSARESGGAFAHRGVITEFMQEMDGLKSSKEDNVIVIGATNRPFDLDDAVLRRLPRRLLVDLPGEKERGEILKILLQDETLALDVDIPALAKKTESFSGSDLKHLCVSAALDSVKENVKVPWATTSTTTSAISDVRLASPTKLAVASLVSGESEVHDQESLPVIVESPHGQPTRILHLHNFAKALKEITPSSSESLGSLAELRKWNDEFGEGGKNKKRQTFWGKGHFGFTDKIKKDAENGRVVSTTSNPSVNDPS
ncbi:hypothetical protein H0H93_011260 [Arthromyces matolae]|nr:hypothetical protein H0H93_011260 [Arthromyces matolae]